MRQEAGRRRTKEEWELRAVGENEDFFYYFLFLGKMEADKLELRAIRWTLTLAEQVLSNVQ